VGGGGASVGTATPPGGPARVLEPFFTTKDIGKGSGLGLPQVYGFAQQSGGEVSITSEVGRGTTVTLLLPRSLHAPAGPRPVDEDVRPRPKAARVVRGHMLLVEDDREV